MTYGKIKVDTIQDSSSNVINVTSLYTLANGSPTFAGDITIPDKIIHASDTNTAIRFPSADTFTIETAGAERLRITSTGLVGVGTASPYNVLTGKTLSIGDGVASSEITLRSSTGGSGALWFGDATSGSGAQSGYIEYAHSSDYLRFATSGTERLRIDSAGDILAKTLDARIGSDVGGVEYGTSANNSVRFYQNNIERMRVEDHRVGIGTSTPDQMLHVKGYNTHGGLVVEAGGTSGSTNQIFIQGHNNAGTTLGEINFEESGTNVGGIVFKTNGGSLTQKAVITSAGNFGIATSSPSKLLDVNGDALINGLTVGRGTGNVSTNTAQGYQALYANTTGQSAVAVGYDCLRYNTTGSNNVAIGQQALRSNTTASNNAAAGFQTLYSNTTGTNNAAFGAYSLYSNTDGVDNTDVGEEALYYNTGSYNSSLGRYSLHKNTTGSSNTAIGKAALYWNTTGSYNTAVGRDASSSNTTGSQNSAVGYNALLTNTTGGLNVAVGGKALQLNTTGSLNVALGYQALYNNTTSSDNTAVG